MADTFWGEIQEVRKGLWAYISGLCLPDQSASEKQITITGGNNSPWRLFVKKGHLLNGYGRSWRGVQMAQVFYALLDKTIQAATVFQALYRDVSPIIPSAPKLMFHRNCACFELSISIQAIDCFLAAETIPRPV